MAFSGTLIKIKTGASTYVDIPWKYIKMDAYKVTPDQRMESSAGRNANGVLQRTTCSHKASKITFDTPDGLTNADVGALYTLLNSGYSYTGEQLARKIIISFYDPESDSVKTDKTCYVPDIDYNISRIDLGRNVITYDSFTVTFIEY